MNASSSEALHPEPAAAAVARETLREVGESVRLEIAAALALMLGLTLIILLGQPGASRGADLDLADMTWPVLAVGLFAPLAVWKSEEPSRRSYMWSMPVERFRHTMVKVAGGWVWLMGLVAVYMLWLISMPLMTGGHIVINPTWEEYLMRSRAPGTLIRDMTMAGYPWLWVVPFVSATMAYLFGTAVALVSNYPLRVYAAAAFLCFVVLGVAESAGGTLDAMADGVFRHGVIGRYGLFTQATGLVYLFEQPPVPGRPIRDMPVLGAWLSASALWMGTGLVAMLLAARRYQER